MAGSKQENMREQLCSMPLLAGLSDQVVTDFERSLLWREFEKGELIYTPEDESCCLRILLEGRAILYVPSDAKKVVVAELASGDVFGAVDAGVKLMFTGESKGNYAEGLDNKNIVGVLYYDQLKQLVRAYPELGLRLLDQMRKRLLWSETVIGELGAGSVEERIVGVLARASQRSGSISKDEFTVAKGVYTHEGLSAMVGASREAVTRSLNRLQRRGVVERNFREYKIRRNKV
jgi:CRP/FNR family transcriptional regulator